jgi:2-iminobutanoate/2-iminopropanoate deaminase
MISNKSIPQKEVVTAQGAPKAIGPYSVGIRAFPWVFCSGQAGLDPETGEIVPGGIEAETHQTITNLKNVLESAGSSLDEVVKTTVFLRDIGDFARMNAVYAKFFRGTPPARSTIQAAALPKGAAVEIEAIALASI